ncbi:MAG: hypothetical protein ACOCWH_02930 [Spirochaetota bacterium]
MKVGEYLNEKGVITQEQLDDALKMQKDNPERVIGEILVTMGLVSKEELIMLMEMYMMETDADINYVDEWLDQDEIDMILEKMD